LSSGGVVADAPQPPATGCDASGIVGSQSVINGREEYKKQWPSVSWFDSSRRALAPGSQKINNRHVSI